MEYSVALSCPFINFPTFKRKKNNNLFCQNECFTGEPFKNSFKKSRLYIRLIPKRNHYSSKKYLCSLFFVYDTCVYRQKVSIKMILLHTRNQDVGVNTSCSV